MGMEHTSGEPQHLPAEIPLAPVALVKRNHHPHELQIPCSSTCSFSNSNYNKFDQAERSRSGVKLRNLTIFYMVVMGVEVVGGIKSNSLGVLTDAVHLLSDIAGFCISLFAVWVSGWEATKRQSFGYHRLEVLGALFSVQLIWLISGVLLYEAIERLLQQNKKVNGELMFGTAAFGFVINLIMVLWLGHDHSHHGHDHDHSHHGYDHDHSHHGHGHDHDHSHHGHDHSHPHHACTGGDHKHAIDEPTEESDEKRSFIESFSPNDSQHSNINIQGAYLHVITDMIQSAGVMIAGGIIWLKPEWFLVDLLCTLMFSFFALITTLPMLKRIFSILMERTPSAIDIIRLEKGIRSINGLDDIRDLHVWAITTGKFVLSCHVVIVPGVVPSEILHMIKHYCEQTFKIHHVTVEIEQKQ